MKVVAFLLLAVAVFSAQAIDFPVKPRTCYEVTFRARVVKGPDFVKNPQLEDIVPMSVSRFNATAVRFNGVNWKFLDASGKAIRRPHEGASPQTLFSREWKEYRYRFWTPENAVKFGIFLMGGMKGNKAELADVALTEVDRPETLNFNCDFSAADDAAPGWQLVGTALFQNIAPGRSEVNTLDGHLNGDLFSVPPGGKIEITAVCADPVVLNSRWDYTNIRLEFYSSYAEASVAGARKKALVEPPLSVYGKSGGGKVSRRYAVPAHVKWARVSAWHGIVKNVSVKTVVEGDAK